MTLPADFQIRRATPADAAIITHHRLEMFRSHGRIDDELEEEFTRQSIPYFERVIAAGTYLGWLAISANTELRNTSPVEFPVVGGAGMVLRQIAPFPVVAPASERRIAAGAQGVVVDVYVAAPFRRRGLASALMRTMMQRAEDEQLDRLVLHSSPAGQPLYESLGFTMTNEMRFHPSHRRATHDTNA